MLKIINNMEYIMNNNRIIIVLISLLLSINAYGFEQGVTLENCHVDGVKAQVQCGKLQVPENYDTPDGDKISINFVVLPAIDDSDNKTPLMFLAGGPGQAAAELASGLRRVFNEVRKTRDLILVDQRGTGDSHPLQCDDALEQDIYTITPEEFSEQDIKDCLASFSGDLSQYNSENAIRDFDAVRAALGHEQINIYGGSYGTRAGLVYMRMFPNSLRSVVLDSVGPIEVPIGLFGQSSARSFNLLLENCQKEESCQKAYPNLESEFNSLLSRLVKEPAQVTIAHPRLGTQTKFVISEAKVSLDWTSSAPSLYEPLFSDARSIATNIMSNIKTNIIPPKMYIGRLLTRRTPTPFATVAGEESGDKSLESVAILLGSFFHA